MYPSTPEWIMGSKTENLESTLKLELAMKRLSAASGKPDDIHTLRDAVIRRIQRKLGSARCDLWTFLRENCSYSDREIRDHLWDGMPMRSASSCHVRSQL